MSNQDTSRQDWHDLHDHAEANRELGFGEIADHLAKVGPMPESLLATPMIIDTDVGDDPDDTIALAITALHVPELVLVITSDERDGMRACFARHLLDLLGRHDVVVVQGAQVNADAKFCVSGLLPAEAPVISTDVIGAVRDALSGVDGTVRWVGIGAMTNLAAIVTREPLLLERLDVTQMGGAIHYRHPDRAEHNIRMDIEAARLALDAIELPMLVISDVTFTPEIHVGPQSPIFTALDETAEDGSWQALLRDHLHSWFEGASHTPPGTLMHDPLTLSVAMGLPFVTRMRRDIGLDDLGRMEVDHGGRPALLSRSARYEPFMKWLARSLGLGLKVS